MTTTNFGWPVLAGSAAANTIDDVLTAALVAADASLKTVSDVANGAVPKTLFDANTVLYATSDNTPVALTVGASTVLGRKASGGIVAMTMTELKAILAAASTDISDFGEAVDDRVAALLVAGTGITLTYNDGANTLTVTQSGFPSWTKVSKTADYTAAAGEFVRVDATGGAVSITVPTTSGAMCKVMKTDSSTNKVTVLQGGGGQTVMYQQDHVRETTGNGTTADVTADRKPFGYADFLDSTAPSTNHTLGLADLGTVIEMNSGSALTLSVPAFATVAWPDGSYIEVYQRGAGQVTTSHATSSAHLEGKGTKTNGQYSTMGMRYRASGDIWVLSGDVTT